MEVYHLTPNTTYEFRIWGNNYLGAGEIVNTIITTLPEIGDEGTISFYLKFRSELHVHDSPFRTNSNFVAGC